MLKEFKEFAMKGNVVDLAVGVIIGGAFNKIVSSLVNDIVMPVIGILTGGVNFTSLSTTLKSAEGKKAAITLNYGQFIQNIVDFLIIAFSIFMVVKTLNKFRREKIEDIKPVEPPAPPADIQLLTEIRDLLKKEDMPNSLE